MQKQTSSINMIFEGCTTIKFDDKKPKGRGSIQKYGENNSNTKLNATNMEEQNVNTQPYDQQVLLQAQQRKQNQSSVIHTQQAITQDLEVQMETQPEHGQQTTRQPLQNLDSNFQNHLWNQQQEQGQTVEIFTRTKMVDLTNNKKVISLICRYIALGQITQTNIFQFDSKFFLFFSEYFTESGMRKLVENFQNFLDIISVQHRSRISYACNQYILHPETKDVFRFAKCVSDGIYKDLLNQRDRFLAAQNMTIDVKGNSYQQCMNNNQILQNLKEQTPYSQVSLSQQQKQYQYQQTGHQAQTHPMNQQNAIETQQDINGTYSNSSISVVTKDQTQEMFGELSKVANQQNEQNEVDQDLKYNHVSSTTPLFVTVAEAIEAVNSIESASEEIFQKEEKWATIEDKELYSYQGIQFDPYALMTLEQSDPSKMSTIDVEQWDEIFIQAENLFIDKLETETLDFDGKQGITTGNVSVDFVLNKEEAKEESEEQCVHNLLDLTGVDKSEEDYLKENMDDLIGVTNYS